MAGITARAAGRLGGFLERARDTIAAPGVAGFDETGFCVDGWLHWVHCARTGKYTLLNSTKGAAGRRWRKWASFLVRRYRRPRRLGAVRHPYKVLSTSFAARAPCANCRPSPIPPLAGQWCWAAHSAEAITAIRPLCEAIGQGSDAVDPAALAAKVRLYRSEALTGASQTAARSGGLMKKHNALACRLRDLQDKYPRFTRDWRIPPDNNGCERDIRMTKLKQKLPGCLHTLTGARQCRAIRSYLSTAAKHYLGLFNALLMLTEGRPWIPPRPYHPANAAPDQLLTLEDPPALVRGPT